MSQRKETVTFEVKTTLTVDDQGDPQAVSVENFGGIPHAAVHSIAQEAVDRFMGCYGHRFTVNVVPAHQEDDTLVWEISD